MARLRKYVNEKPEFVFTLLVAIISVAVLWGSLTSTVAALAEDLKKTQKAFEKHCEWGQQIRNSDVPKMVKLQADVEYIKERTTKVEQNIERILSKMDLIMTSNGHQEKLLEEVKRIRRNQGNIRSHTHAD